MVGALPSRREWRSLNYRHGFHAGNHTEPFKHAVLWTLIELLKSKDKPFMVLDTHAGAGLHDLRSGMALRTREADSGITRLMTCVEPALTGYLDIVRDVGGVEPILYPGSPEIIRRSLRSADRLVACELHHEDAVTLRSHMAGDKRVSVHVRDGYEATLALIPPIERRGLVFVDPPYETLGEEAKLGNFLLRACTKWPTGIFAAWYPIKSAAAGNAVLRSALESPARSIVSARFTRFRIDEKRLAGGGMVIFNPPWHAEDRIAQICCALREGFGAGDWSMDHPRST